MNNCEFGRQETGPVGGNRIRFDDSIGQAPNPLKIPFKKWPVSIHVIQLILIIFSVQYNTSFRVVNTPSTYHEFLSMP